MSADYTDAELTNVIAAFLRGRGDRGATEAEILQVANARMKAQVALACFALVAEGVEICCDLDQDGEVVFWKPAKAEVGENPDASERVGRTETPERTERAAGVEKPERPKRSVVAKGAACGERAITPEKPVSAKRAVVDEQPVDAERSVELDDRAPGKRADGGENCAPHERSECAEEPVVAERSGGAENPGTAERSSDGKNPAVDERAGKREEPVVEQRADDLEKPETPKRRGRPPRTGPCRESGCGKPARWDSLMKFYRCEECWAKDYDRADAEYAPERADAAAQVKKPKPAPAAVAVDIEKNMDAVAVASGVDDKRRNVPRDGNPYKYDEERRAAWFWGWDKTERKEEVEA